MKICLVGGIYDKPAQYRENVKWTPETTLEAALSARGHDVVTLGHRHTGRGSLPLSEHFDVIHVHHLGRGAIAAASDSSQIPFVFTSHTAARTQLERLALLAVMARADGIVALSAARQLTHCTNGALHAAIPNGVDAARFRPRVPSKPNEGEPWRLLFAGQLIPLKRVDLLLDAVASLRRRFPIRLKLAYHVGVREQSLRMQAQSLGIEAIVEFAGPLTQSALADAYREAHVLVLPSDTESLPSVVSEAMMSGTPVVATDVGSLRDQLAGYGVIVPVGSASSLSAGIEAMFAEYDFHATRALEMSRSARDRFSVDVMAIQHENFYRAVVSGRHKARRHSRRNLAGTRLLGGALRAWNKIKR